MQNKIFKLDKLATLRSHSSLSIVSVSISSLVSGCGGSSSNPGTLQSDIIDIVTVPKGLPPTYVPPESTYSETTEPDPYFNILMENIDVDTYVGSTTTNSARPPLMPRIFNCDSCNLKYRTGSLREYLIHKL